MRRSHEGSSGTSRIPLSARFLPERRASHPKGIWRAGEATSDEFRCLISLTGDSFPQVEQNPVFEVVAMSHALLITPMRRGIFAAVALLFAASFAAAQAAPSQDESSAAGYSSSQAGLSDSGLQLSEFSLPNESELGMTASDGGGAGQYGNGGGYGGGEKHGLFHKWAFE